MRKRDESPGETEGVSPSAILRLGESQSSSDETGDAELLTFGETSNSNPEPSPENHLPRSAHQGLFNENPPLGRG